MILLLLKLLTAHSIGDFVLQPGKWINDKRRKKHKSVFLYLHILVHTIVLLIIFGFNWNYWLAFIIIPFSHLLIDLVKTHFENRNNSRGIFLIDQLAHLLIILGVVYLYEPYHLDSDLIYSFETLLMAFALICLIFVISIIMKVIMSQWEVEGDNESLENAGKYIGILERLFVFGFIVLNQWQVIGFLIAAKSVFRFGDLSKARDRKLTEYILIGTLLSFGMAVFIGILYKYALNNFVE
jgi:hypothetical protein